MSIDFKDFQDVVAMMTPRSGIRVEEFGLKDFGKILRDFAKSRHNVCGSPLCDTVDELYDFAWHPTYEGELESVEVVYGDELNNNSRRLRLTYSNQRAETSEWFERWLIEVPVIKAGTEGGFKLYWEGLVISNNLGCYHRLSPGSFISDKSSNDIILNDLSDTIHNLSKFGKELLKLFNQLHQNQVGAKGKQINKKCYFGTDSLFTRYFRQIEEVSGYLDEDPDMPVMNKQTRLCINRLIPGGLFSALTFFADEEAAKSVDKSLMGHIVTSIMTMDLASDVQESVALEALKWAKVHLNEGDKAVAESFPLNHNDRFSRFSSSLTRPLVIDAYLSGASAEAVEQYINVLDTVTAKSFDVTEDIRALQQKHLLAGSHRDVVVGRKARL